MRGPEFGINLILTDRDRLGGKKAHVRETRYHSKGFIFDLVVVLSGSEKHPGASNDRITLTDAGELMELTP